MLRSLTLTGAVALSLILPLAAAAAPPGGSVRATRVFVRPANSERSGTAARDEFRVPFEIAPRLKPPMTTWRGWELRPTLLWNPILCAASMAPLVAQGPQTFSTDELQTPGFTIGSLAGNPSRSIFARSPSEIAAMAASKDAAINSDAPSGVSFQYRLQPALCGQSAFAPF